MMARVIVLFQSFGERELLCVCDRKKESERVQLQKHGEDMHRSRIGRGATDNNVTETRWINDVVSVITEIGLVLSFSDTV